MSGFRFVAAAIDELEDAAAYYAAQSEQLSLGLRNEVDRAVCYLIEFPFAPPAINARYRSYKLRRFPDHLIYRFEADELAIAAVAYTSRRPSYWRGRV